MDNMFGLGNMLFSIGAPQGFNVPGYNFQQVTQQDLLNAIQNSIGEQPLYAGVFDPSSLLSGLGIASDGIPTAPSLDVYQSLYALQSDHSQEQEDYLKEANFEIGQKKEKVFAQQHFEFDADGNPVKDEETGKNKLVDGAETADQRATRQTWEHNQETALNASHDAENKQFQADSQAQTEAAMNNYNSNPGDPAAAQKMQLISDELQQQQQELNLRQVKENLLLGTDGLPDLDNIIEPEIDPNADPNATPPPPQYKPLSDFALEKYDAYTALIQQHGQAEQSTPEYQSITGYYNSLQGFLDTQKQELAMMGIDINSPDLDAMRQLKFLQY